MLKKASQIKQHVAAPRRAGIALACLGLFMGAHALAKVPRVVTDLLPTHALASLVMGDLGTPSLLLRAANVHSAHLRPSQLRTLSDADVIFWIGPQMTPQLEASITRIGGSGKALALLETDGTYQRHYEGEGARGGHDHGRGTLHDAAEHEDHGTLLDADHEGHETSHESESEGDHGHIAPEGALDPHAWLDPQNAAHWLDVIAARLSDLDPENAAQYAQNAQSARRDIAKMDRDIAALLAPLSAQRFITGHDAYGYFTAHYGLSPLGALAHGDAAAPGAAHLAALNAKIIAQRPACVFPEAGQERGYGQHLSAQENGLKVGAALDPEGITQTPGPQAYARLMHALANSFARCLSPP